MTDLSFRSVEGDFVEIIPLTEDLLIGINEDREMWIINMTAEPRRATRLGLFTDYDPEKLKHAVLYVTHGGEKHPHFH